MKQRKFNIFFLTIIVTSLLLRILPALNYNFYFTMDQANDALHAREIWQRHQLLLTGPETGIDGLFAGPLWYYLIAIGYGALEGNPAGGLIICILLSVFLTAYIILFFSSRVGIKKALIIGTALQIFWPFYDISRYCFNPFPLVFLSFLIILSLINCIEGNFPSLSLAAIPVGIAFNMEVAGAIALFFFYLTASLFLIIKKGFKIKYLLLGGLFITIFLIPHLIAEIISGFAQFEAIVKKLSYSQNGITGTNFKFMLTKFFDIIRESIIPQSLIASAVYLCFLSTTSLLALKMNAVKTKSEGTKTILNFLFLLFGLLLISYFWFSLTKGWQTWHTVFLAPLIFTECLLLITLLPQKIAILFFLPLILAQFLSFRSNYIEYYKPSADQSLLTNELAAVDWVYKKAEGQGFFAYSYLPSVYDYPYQYLYWWRGLNKYGYLPCEYSSYPGIPTFSTPGLGYYQNPKRQCHKLLFLIIEPDKNDGLKNQWLQEVTVNTNLVAKTFVGKIEIQMREKANSPSNP